ncbi:MAG: 30S ribosomal protein S3 [Nitrospinota bacterium]|nr:30S ribosomal protein S3 [Nitrospinota bacterium]
MGQKVHPIGFRLGINKDWQSSWYAKKDYVSFLHEDIAIRKYIKKELYHAGIARIAIERSSNKLKINVMAARPGIIIGKRGSEVDRLKENIQKRVPERKLILNIVEVRRPEANAQLIAENIALQIERRVAFRRAMKKTIQSAMRFGAKGIRVNCAGRLAGHEIARVEWYREGRVPLHTIRADIDLGFAEAHTAYGLIGVKVWVFNGEIIPERVEAVEAAAE